MSSPNKKKNKKGKRSSSLDEMNKSIKELTETVKKLQEFLLTKAFNLPEEKETPTEIGNECCFDCEEACADSTLTLFVKGFEYLRPRHEIKKALTNIFSLFGVVTRVFVPIECRTQCPLGFAFIDLRFGEGNDKALELNGKCVEGRELQVTMAFGRAESSGFTDFDGCDRCIGCFDKSRVFSGRRSDDMFDYSYGF